MDLVSALALGLLIGAILGGLGGGGAILTVPALVYIVGQPAQEATTSSLVIVGLTALVGVGSYLSSRRVSWRLGGAFAVIGLPATWAGSFLNHRVDPDALLLGFAVLMAIAAAAMIAKNDAADPQAPETSDGSTSTDGTTSTDGAPGSPTSAGHRGAVASNDGHRPLHGVSVLTPPSQTSPPRPTHGSTPASHKAPLLAVVATALGVGLLTGFFGVGGGFVVVPALVLVLRQPMRLAVGTSLLIVAANSATSLLARATTAQFDWSVIVPLTLAAMVATLLGKRVADRLPARRLKVGFATLLVLVAGYTAWQSIVGLTENADSSAGSATAAPSATSAPVDNTGSDTGSGTGSGTGIATPAEAREAIAAGAQIIDVRTPEEFAAGHLTDALNIDLSAPDFDQQVAELDPSGSYVVYCASGNRSTQAVDLMRASGFESLTNAGGYDDLARLLPSSTS